MRNWFIAILLVSGGVLTVRMLITYLVSIPLFGPLIFARMVDMNRGAQLDALGIIELILLLTVTLLALLVKKKLKGYNIRFLCNLIMVTSFAIITFMILGANEMSVRFFFYIYFLMFALLPCITKLFKPKGVVSGGLVLISSLSFVNSILLGEWSYKMHFLPIITPLIGLI